MSAITTSSIYNSSSTNCKDLERVGFASHPTCYVDNGFCTDILTSSTNLVCLGKDVLEFRDFFNKLAVNQVSSGFLTSCYFCLHNSYRCTGQLSYVHKEPLISFCSQWAIS